MKQIWTISIIIASLFTLTHVDRLFGGEIRYHENLSQNGQAGAVAPVDAIGVNIGTLSSNPSFTNKSDEPDSRSFRAPNISNNEDKMSQYKKADDGVGERK